MEALTRWSHTDGTGVDYVTVRSWGRVRVTAGSPDGPPATRRLTARAFEADARRAGARVLWFAVEHPDEIGPDRPSMVVGADPVWASGRWPAIVASKASVRAQIRRAQNKGVAVDEWPSHRVSASADLFHVLTDWLARRGLPPLSFMADPFVLVRQSDRRFWVGKQGSRVVGYLVLRPGDETYVEWIIQRRDAPNGTAARLLDTALRACGSPAFTLGMVPLSTHAPLSASLPPPTVRALLAWTRAHATRFYNFGGLERFKAKFEPDAWRPMHLVTDGRPISIVTVHTVAAAFSAPRGPTRFVAHALADAAMDEGRRAAETVRGALSWPGSGR